MGTHTHTHMHIDKCMETHEIVTQHPNALIGFLMI